MKCDQAELLIETHLSGELESKRLRALRQHTADCQQCQAEFALADETARLLRASLLAVVAVAPSPQPFIRNWVATSRLVTQPSGPKPISNRIPQPQSMMPMMRYGSMAAALLVPVMLMLTMAILFKPVQESTKHNYALATLANIQVALQHYHSDWDAFPPSGDDNLVRFLDGDPENGGPARTYFHFLPSQLSASGEYLDPWGSAYHYRRWQPDSQLKNTRRFDLWSQGRRGNDPEKYITNWRDLPPPP